MQWQPLHEQATEQAKCGDAQENLPDDLQAVRKRRANLTSQRLREIFDKWNGGIRDGSTTGHLRGYIHRKPLAELVL